MLGKTANSANKTCQKKQKPIQYNLITASDHEKYLSYQKGARHFFLRSGNSNIKIMSQILMKLNGSHKFSAASQSVFNAILNPSVLQSAIPGCESIAFVDSNTMRASVTTPLPGSLKGPFTFDIKIAQAQAPNHLVLQVQRTGRGGSVNATSQINLADEAGGTLLNYDANAELEGAIAAANNPIGQGVVKNTLNNFFKNIEKAIA